MSEPKVLDEGRGSKQVKRKNALNSLSGSEEANKRV